MEKIVSEQDGCVHVVEERACLQRVVISDTTKQQHTLLVPVAIVCMNNKVNRLEICGVRTAGS